jgi:hypothetical protein
MPRATIFCGTTFIPSALPRLRRAGVFIILAGFLRLTGAFSVKHRQRLSWVGGAVRASRVWRSSRLASATSLVYFSIRSSIVVAAVWSELTCGWDSTSLSLKVDRIASSSVVIF